jgi:hypothetical protein
MRVLVTCFRGNISEQVMEQLNDEYTKVTLNSTIAGIEKFIESTDFNEYDYILAMGMYSGRDQDRIRIETECSSRFRNTGSNEEKIRVPYFMQATNGMKFAKGIGNSWCNRLSYKILSKSPDCYYTFLHIPKSLDPVQIARNIDIQLDKKTGCI